MVLLERHTVDTLVARLAVVETETLGNKLGDVEDEALVDTLADKVAEVEAEALADTLGDV